MSPSTPSSPATLGFRLVADHLAGSVIVGLARHDVRAILLKGPSLRALLYDENEARVSHDIDLLLDERELPAAESALPSLGFRFVGVTTSGRGRPHRRAWLDAHTGIPLELHVKPTGAGAEPREVWRELSATTRRMRVGAHEVEVLGDPALALHIVLNVAHHGRANPKTMADLERALTRIPRPVWSEATRLAERLEASAAFAAGLRLLAPGAVLARELGVDARPTVEVALRAETAPPMAQGLEWLRGLPSNRARLRFVLRALFPPPEFMRVWSPRARRGRLGLVAAYLGRPLWMVTLFPRAFRAWRQARRAAAR